MTDYELEEAYDIKGPRDAKKLYDDWAATYDSSFGEGWGYIAPREIAAIYNELSDGNEPVLDIGAGTGLLAESMPGMTVDAFDISAEMLAKAEAKGLYRARHVGDLTQPLALDDASYGGVISCGTFTHGHVGPEALPELIRVTRPGALFVCGCIPPVFDGMGFGSTLGLMVARREIAPVDFRDIAIYEEGMTHEHARDRGLVMAFRRL